MKRSKFLVRESKDGQHYFVLVAPNGKIILTSEMYQNLNGVSVGIHSVMSNAIYENFNLTNEKGNYRFTLKAKNGEIVGVSEGYRTKQGRDKGIRAVIKYAPISRFSPIQLEIKF